MNTSELNKINIVYTFFNQFVFPEVKYNINYIRQYYKLDPSTSNNTLITRLLNIIKEYDLDKITGSTFQLALIDDGKTDGEIAEIIGRVKEAKSYNKDQVSEIIGHVRKIAHQALIKEAGDQFPDDPVAFVDYIKKAEYRSNHGDKITMISFDELNISDIYAEYVGGIIKSKIPLINQSYPLGGYVNGQIVMVISPPGGGKSMLMMAEADNFIAQGKRVHYLAMGDLRQMDFVIRMAALGLEVDLWDTTQNIIHYHSIIKSKYSNNLKISVVPSGSLTATEYYEFIRNYIDDFDVFMVDYDSNFATDETMTMYDQHGHNYDMLGRITSKGKLLFVGSQPKAHYWTAEVLGLDAAGESTRKQHITDMMITIGLAIGSGTKCGMLSIPKNRRGTPGASEPYVMTKDGNIHVVSHALYGLIKRDRSPKRLSRQDLELMEMTTELNMTS